MYELHLFQGKWDGSSVIPEFKPRERELKKKMEKHKIWNTRIQQDRFLLEYGMG